MKKNSLDQLESIQTPFYLYDLDLLKETLETIERESSKYNFHIHYALKANANSVIITEIQRHGFGVDCVSGYEVNAAIAHGFDPKKIVFAGVGKADWEINLALEAGIQCFNVESLPELEIIDELAEYQGVTATVALRINPNVDAHTHQYITTGLEENKFGIGLWELESIINRAKELKHINLTGIHFHIGSQIMDLDAFRALCSRINEIQRTLDANHLKISTINVGGGLGVDYEYPDEKPIADFERYFAIFNKFLDLRPGQSVHFELGRSVVAQCGSLITRVLYVKNGRQKKFAIVDAGMNDLIRPALYHAYHKIENITSTGQIDKYDVVGPVCESSDCFGKEIPLNETKRDDILAIRSAGAYGEIMASRYNLREFAKSYFMKSKTEAKEG